MSKDKATTVSVAPPKEVEAHTSEASAMPTYSAIVNVYDPVARHGDGSACPLSAWPRTGDAKADRKAFAAAFLGLSGSFVNPRAKEANLAPRTPIRITVGGVWSWPVKGDVQAKAPVGPAIDSNGKWIAGTLEVVEPSEAIGEAIAADGNGWKIRLRVA